MYTILRHKNHDTIVLCVNADTSHAIPVTLTGHAKNHTCLKQPRFT